MGGRHRGRLEPALRRPAVLRRSARGVHLRPGQAGALAARAAGRCLPGRGRDAGVPARAADPRTAHPAREGDLEHLHRAGAAGGHREHVRGLPRPPRTGRHRDGRARRGVGVGRRPDRRWSRPWCTTTSSTRCSPGCPDGPRPSSAAAAREPGPPAAGGRRPRRDLGRTGRHRRRSDGGPRGVRRDRRRRPPPERPGWGSEPYVGVPHPPGVQHPPQRDRDAAVSPGAVGPRLRARPRHDPARLLHHEAERDHGDGADLLPGLRRPAPVRARRGRRRVRDPDPRAGGLAGRADRLRAGVPPAQRRQPGRAGRTAGHPGVPPGARRRAADGVSDPVVGARHQRRVGGDGGHEGGGGQGHPRRFGRSRRPQGQGRDPSRPAGRDHGHLPVHPRRVRGGHHRSLRAGARRRRPGVRGRRQPERPAGSGQAGAVRCGRQPPQPPQDLLHPARRRRSRGGSRRGRGAPGAVPARSPSGRDRG